MEEPVGVGGLKGRVDPVEKSQGIFEARMGYREGVW